MLEVWMEVLRNKSIDLDSNFFDVGGHSLSAASLTSRIYNVFGVKLSLKQLFEAATPKQCCELIGNYIPAKKLLAPINNVHESDSYPLSFAQRRLWFLDKLNDLKLTYHLPKVYTIMGALDVVSFERAFAALITRHESLRTNIREINDEPRQIIHPVTSFNFKLNFDDLSPRVQ